MGWLIAGIGIGMIVALILWGIVEEYKDNW